MAGESPVPNTLHPALKTLINGTILHAPGGQFFRLIDSRYKWRKKCQHCISKCEFLFAEFICEIQWRTLKITAAENTNSNFSIQAMNI